MTDAELIELADSGLNLDARVDPTGALVEEAVQQSLVQAAYTGAEVAVHNGITPGRVRNKAAARELVCLLIDGVQRFPRFQFDDAGRFRPGLDKTTPHIPEDWSWVGYRNFLSIPALQMDGRMVTPLQWLAAGKPAADVIAGMGNTW